MCVGGGYWRTATRDDEPRPVWTSLPITRGACVRRTYFWGKIRRTYFYYHLLDPDLKIVKVGNLRN